MITIPPNLKPALSEYMVTVWMHPKERIQTQWGYIYCQQWLECEIDRWEETNLRPAWIRVNPEGLIALFCDPSSICYVKPE